MATIDGTKNNDTLSGTAGDDLIKAADGDDIINSSDGSDTLDGGAGIDTANYLGSLVAIVANLVTGKVSKTNGGTDTLIGIERIVGSNLADLMTGSGANDDFTGNLGDDTLDGSGGVDTADYGNTNGAVNVDLQAGTATGAAGHDTLTSIESVKGSAFDDTLLGSSADNIFMGEGGNFLRGAGGNDLIDGRDGVDEVDYLNDPGPVTVNLATRSATDGRGGNDTLISIENVSGSRFGDTLNGDAGNNRLRGREGDDTLNGGDGTDTASYDSAKGGVNVSLSNGSSSGADGNDVLVHIENLIGSAFADTLTGDNNDNAIDGLAGDDIINGEEGKDILRGGAGNDLLNGGSSENGTRHLFNTALYDDSPGPINVLLGLGAGVGNGTASDGWGSTDTLININVILGSAFNDSITGSNGLVFEQIEGGTGDDILDGGAITDTLNYDNANRVSYKHASGAVLVDLKAGTTSGADGADRLAAMSFNQVQGSDFNDSLYGSDRTDVTESFEGRSGNDHIDGRGGFDLVHFTHAAKGVQASLVSGTATDVTAGGNLASIGSDTFVNVEGLVGSAFDDILIGGLAANGVTFSDGKLEFFRGNEGNDVIDGGQGFDIADYSTSTSGVVATLNGSADGSASDGLDGTDVLRRIEGLYGSPQGDTLTGSDSAEMELFRGDAGNDMIDGKGGTDLVDYYNSRAGVNVSLATGRANNDGFDGVDTLLNIEDVRGSRDFNDSIQGSNADNVLHGLGGDDTLDGGAGLDTASYDASPSGVVVTLNGGSPGSASDGWGGSDVLRNIEAVRGSSFDDTLNGSDDASFESFEGRSGNDRIDGKGGVDRADYTWAAAGVIANLLNQIASDDGTGGVDSLLNIENLRGSRDFNDDLTGDNGNNLIEALGGNDALNGGDGNDTLDGGVGFDTAFFNGQSANYKVTSTGTGRFTVEDLVGGDGIDSLIDIEQFAFLVPGKLDGAAIVGTDSFDIVTYKAATTGVTVDLTKGTVTSAEGTNTLQSIEGAIGSDFEDTLLGNQANNSTLGTARMAGGKGSDVYVVYNPGDLVVETDNVGTTPGAVQQQQPLDLGSNIDKVISSINYTLTNFVEILELAADGGNLSGIGNALDNVLTGNDANNSISGKGGNDEVDGKGGVDTALFSGARAGYNLSKGTNGFTVKDNVGTEGTDTLSNVERTKFSDMGLALDLDGSAGITAKILGAVFGKESIANQEYAGIGLSLLDSGMSYEALVQLALDVRLGAAASNTDVVNLLYTNIVGTAPSASELALYKGMLDDGSFTHAGIGIFAADTPLNGQNVDLVGLSVNGLGFI